MSENLIAMSLPGAPLNVSASKGEGAKQVILRWNAPAETGGSPITSYLISFSTNAGSTWKSVNNNLICSCSCGDVTYGLTISNLNQSYDHIFRVAAKNSSGTGPYSTVTSSVYPAGAPLKVGNIIVTKTEDSVTLNWTPPVDSTGITDYIVTYTPV